MERTVLPEYLDALPFDHAEAETNRRELRAFNWYLGTNRWFKRELSRIRTEGGNLLEIGAGEGCLVQYLQSSGSNFSEGVHWAALDCVPVFKGDRDRIKCIVEDLMDFDGYANFDVIFGNMILHQFKGNALHDLGAKLKRGCHALVFQEPLRSSFHYGLCRIATLPFGRVTRHDAVVSIRAGFREGELPSLLGLDPEEWDIREMTTLRGAYRLFATRK